MLQHTIVHGLSTTGRSHEHETMTHLDCIIELNDLCDEDFYRLHIIEGAGALNGLEEATIVGFGFLDAWEEIKHDVLEQREIILQELRYVDITQGTEKKLTLIHVRVGTLQETCCINDRAHSSHTVIVVVLGRQLLRAELEGRDHLSCKISTGEEPEGIEHDLTNQCLVGDHHSHWSEQGFEVVGEL